MSNIFSYFILAFSIYITSRFKKKGDTLLLVTLYLLQHDLYKSCRCFAFGKRVEK